jgi:voltage-dependent potassium channel beta subunit
MDYRYLGNTGLVVSVLSYGNWINAGTEKDYEIARDCIKKCFDAGVNFFDTAEIYGFGEAEKIMGRAFKELNLPREELVVSTKLFTSSLDINKPNAAFLSRKHILEGIKSSLEKLQLDYVDILYCHRPDYDTPLEETCRAMHHVIDLGLSFYWGTSEWPSDRITEAIAICDANNWHRPVVEQPEYNMLVRNKFEKEYRRVFSEHKHGSTIWSPLAGGILTGKYNDGKIPEGSRYAKLEGRADYIWQKYMGPEVVDKTMKTLNDLDVLAKSLGFTMSQLGLAWALANTDVSTCLLGFSKVE